MCEKRISGVNVTFSEEHMQFLPYSPVCSEAMLEEGLSCMGAGKSKLDTCVIGPQALFCG